MEKIGKYPCTMCKGLTIAIKQIDYNEYLIQCIDCGCITTTKLITINKPTQPRKVKKLRELRNKKHETNNIWRSTHKEEQ